MKAQKNAASPNQKGRGAGDTGGRRITAPGESNERRMSNFAEVGRMLIAVPTGHDVQELPAVAFHAGEDQRQVLGMCELNGVSDDARRWWFGRIGFSHGIECRKNGPPVRVGR